MSTKHDSKCLQNAADDEPIFVLRGQDATSAKIILHWIVANFDTCPEDKLKDAFSVALEMRKFPQQKIAD